MDLKDKIYIAGHCGLVGSAIVRQLESRGFTNLLMRTHKELDLTNQAQVQYFFKQEKPDYVILAAGKVGGIHANNTYPADFIYQNIMIEANVINSAYENKVKRLLFLGSTCIYPKAVEQPMREEAILTDVLESTNEPYALAKIAGIKLCESYLNGPRQNQQSRALSTARLWQYKNHLAHLVVALAIASQHSPWHGPNHAWHSYCQDRLFLAGLERCALTP